MNTDDIIYIGEDLSNIDVNTCNDLSLIIQKIDSILSPANLANIFINRLNTDSAFKSAFCSLSNPC
jgi:hypothetical protein